MSKYLAIAMLAIVAVFTIANAEWYGTVTKTSSGGDRMGYIRVYALGGNTPAPNTGANAQGQYGLTSEYGMVNGQYYACVWADTTISGTYYGGQHVGGYYYTTEYIQKDIVVTNPPNYCNFDK